jgi:hypothetical protein
MRRCNALARIIVLIFYLCTFCLANGSPDDHDRAATPEQRPADDGVFSYTPQKSGGMTTGRALINAYEELADSTGADETTTHYYAGSSCPPHPGCDGKANVAKLVLSMLLCWLVCATGLYAYYSSCRIRIVWPVASEPGEADNDDQQNT